MSGATGAVPLDAADFVTICKLVCPHCRVGHMPVQRADTKEWCHTMSPVAVVAGGAAQFTHTICWADGFRRSRYAPPGVVF
ncbi:MAG: hypothetical protein ACREFP_24625 [Acetobacteraceae bacterium]